jgi:putative sterol carrier protein
MAAANLREILEHIGNVDPAQVQGMDAVILFDLSGEEGGKWTVTLADGQVDVEEGATASPTMTLSMDARDFVAMSNGELNAINAFMQGKIKISGDMALAMRLQSLLP